MNSSVSAWSSWRSALLHRAVLVASLGYFVDVYDLVLFSIVRVASLRSLGVAEDQLLTVGVQLLNMQMIGMLIGGVLWGVLGDRHGRISVLFGSIALYSLANIANAFATTTAMYAVLRLLAGIGLAGELGAAVTLVSETLPRETRGYGTSFVAGFGVSGAIVAAAVAANFDWRASYVVGGVMGLLLLLLRLRMAESGMFSSLSTKTGISKGNFFQLFTQKERFWRYLRCILIGMPTWFVIGILVTFSPEICAELGATGKITAGTSILFNYAGLIVGDLASGLLSQWWRSRRKVVAVFVTLTMAGCAAYLLLHGRSPAVYYGVFFILGCSAGYWALFVTIAAEQFGTNLRATVATTAPNFIRGSVVLLTMALTWLRGSFGLTGGAMIVGAGCFALTFAALWRLPETFGKDLDFVEGAGE